jgi:hypothetical protein
MNICKKSVGFLERGISPVGRLLFMQENANKKRMRKDIHKSSQIRTHDPNVWMDQDTSCLRLYGHCEWPHGSQTHKLRKNTLAWKASICYKCLHNIVMLDHVIGGSNSDELCTEALTAYANCAVKVPQSLMKRAWQLRNSLQEHFSPLKVSVEQETLIPLISNGPMFKSQPGYGPSWFTFLAVFVSSFKLMPTQYLHVRHSLSSHHFQFAVV